MQHFSPNFCKLRLIPGCIPLWMQAQAATLAAMDATTRYPIPAGEIRIKQEFSRSRFITTLAPADSPEAAKAFIARVAAEFSDATHNCWAFLAGPPGSMAQVGMSDDGEPHGTAGRPMLNELAHSGLGDVAVVVTRYFGGTKLGKGGLVRAYGGGVKQALAEVPRGERIEWVPLAITLAYPLLERARLLLPQFEAELEGEEFTDVVRLTLRVPEEHADALRAAITELSAGRAGIE
jgi:uncharacterized YigZ family protein